MNYVPEAKRRLFARLIACAARLDQPFTDQPELSPWKLLKRDMEALDAAIKGAWVVRKIDHDETRAVTPIVKGGWIHRDEGISDPEHTRFYAAQLLAAADQASRTDTEETTT